MANQWFRLYHEFAIDPKIQMLSEPDQRRYVMLLCLRCSNGDVTLHDEQVAFQLRISNDEWIETKRTLVSKGLVDDRSMPTNWDKRQYISDSSAARVAKHREKKKQACNVTVTPPDTDTDTDTDIKNTPLAMLVDMGVNKKIAQDWLKVRKTKRLAATQTAFDQVMREAEKAGMTMNDAVTRSAQESWGGFKASWLENKGNGYGKDSGNSKQAQADQFTEGLKNLSQTG